MFMSNTPSLDPQVEVEIYRLMLMLYTHGIRQVHLGGLMRVLGVDNTVASHYDQDRVIMNDDFVRQVSQLTQLQPCATTLH